MKFSVRAFWEKTKAVLTKELHANTSPFRASLSLAVGVLVGLSPFYGIHTFIILILAYLFGLNRPLALAATGLTLLPFVPLWIAGGILIGKLVIPVENAGRIVDAVKGAMTSEHFWNLAAGFIAFCRRFLPQAVFDTVDEEANHGIIDGFVQWLIGCSVLAVTGALITFAVCYVICIRRAAAQRKKLSQGMG